MLICNNCFTVNEDGATKCVHCRMPDNFTMQNGERKSDEGAVIHARVVCRNCGSDTPGEDTRCFHCRYPMPARKQAPGVENGEGRVQLFQFQAKRS